MVVTALSYGGVDLLTQTTPGIFDNLDIRAADTAGNADGIITLNELNGVILGTLTALVVPTPSGAATKEFAMTVSIPSNTGNGIQGGYRLPLLLPSVYIRLLPNIYLSHSLKIPC